ncbi:MAG: SOS response-associated peptidase [Chromatiaceae bacterium]|nr:SOS response-associated peptidase [Chromatiaceae bacterium]
MCGRFNLITDAQALIDFFELSSGVTVTPRYNISPSQNLLAVRQHDSRREALPLHWGLLPHWVKDRKTAFKMINARAETVAEKPAFRNALRHRRCLIPASGFYEWRATEKGVKQPYHIRPKEGGLMAFAGLWESWSGADGEHIESCTIIVTTANETLRPIHDRMPVIVPREQHTLWLDTAIQAPDRLKPLLIPCPEEVLVAYPVSRMVGNPANDGPECVVPLSP